MPAARLPGFAPTVRVAGAVPVVGATVSQLPPLAVATVAVNGSGTPPAPTLRLWGAGFGPPNVKLNVNGLGVTDSVPTGETSKDTGIVCVALVAPGLLMVIDPV